MADVIVNNPTELVQYVIAKTSSDTEKLKINIGDFVKWFIRSRVWYDPNVCACKKKSLNEEMIVNEYKALVTMNAEEKEKAYRVIGDSVVLNFNGELLGRLP